MTIELTARSSQSTFFTPIAIEYIAKTSMLTLRIHRCKRIQARTCKALLRPAGGRRAAAAIVNAAAIR